ncbi:hypothetical protein DSC45_02265 [Streptomyces sp. YIM 130001]|uniref:DUF6332 family protein n=1 Tax=Streptomyces sp. YIM 130001 TaxID=2259644 RepID=UPI000E657275|nr:DUF6332 family protein [Streptomyces sp. YIM 130001]RII20928.1 hypothetical protein DSC45_02265 [Streptomyces sp. YIM 130001]
MGGRPPHDAGRESRWEKDEATVEIMFALFSATVLAALGFGACVLVFGSGAGVVVGTVVALLTWIARVVRVLVGYRHRRDLGR